MSVETPREQHPSSILPNALRGQGRMPAPPRRCLLVSAEPLRGQESRLSQLRRNTQAVRMPAPVFAVLEQGMGLDHVATGKNPPDEINVIIEIPKDSEPVKYEVDKESGAI